MTNAPPMPQPKPRWTQRFLEFPLTRIVLALVCVLAPFTLVQLLLRPPGVHDAFVRLVPDKMARQCIVLPILALVLILGYRAYVRWFEKRPVVELGSKGVALELGSGIALGMLLISATVGILAALGAYQVTGSNPWTVLPVPLTEMIMAAILEELLFRAILFRILEQRLGTWIALLISAAVFGAVHLGNANATVLSSCAIMLEAGLLLGAAFILTRRLWLCIGIHFAWNFGEGAIYSVPVSGESAHGLLVGTIEGPTWLTGGSFGVEASVIATALCTLAGIGLLVAALRRAPAVRPRWKHAQPAPASA